MTISPPLKGLFITFEGIDGSGKSTQLECCADALRESGKAVVVTRNPGGTDLGQQLREILLHTSHPVDPVAELLLFMADRAQHTAELVVPALERGEIVLCDRHIDSTLAYQGYGRGLSLDTIASLNQLATMGKEPDLTFWFDGDVATLASRVTKRGKADRLEGESLAFRERVRDGFSQLADQNPQRIVQLNALNDIDMLHLEVMGFIANTFSAQE